MKKGQITLFILIGVSMLIFFGIIFMKPNDVVDDLVEVSSGASRIAYTKTALHSYVDDCLGEIALEAVDSEGILSESAIKDYIESEIERCIDDDAFKSVGIDVVPSDPQVEVSFDIGDSAMIVESVIPILIPVKEGEISEVSEFRFTMDIEKETPLNIDEGGYVREEYKIKSGDQDMELIIPEGVIAKDPEGNVVTDVKIKVIPNDDTGIVGTVQYEITPHLEFSEPVELVFDFEGEEGIDPDVASVVYLSNGLWRAVDTDFDMENMKATGHVDHFSRFAFSKDCGAPEQYMYFRTGDITDGVLGKFDTSSLVHNGEISYAFYLNQPNTFRRLCLRSFELVDIFSYTPVAISVNDEPMRESWDPYFSEDMMGKCVTGAITGENYYNFLESMNNLLGSDALRVGDNEISFDVRAVIPEKIENKALVEDYFITCEGYCATQENYAICMDDCGPAEFDWHTELMFRISASDNDYDIFFDDNDYAGKCSSEEENDLNLLLDELFYFRVPLDGNPKELPLITPIDEDGNIEWRENVCGQNCGDGIKQDYEMCDYASEIEWAEYGVKGGKYWCEDGMYLKNCNLNCEYPDYSVGYYSGVVEKECGWHPEYCNMGSIECGGRFEGSACITSEGIDGTCTLCKCVPNTCGDGVFDQEIEFCEKKSEDDDDTVDTAYSCKDDKYMLKCNFDCTAYVDEGLCGGAETGCGLSSPECYLRNPDSKKEAMQNGAYGICDEDCQFHAVNCGDGILQKYENEMCDTNEVEFPWAERNEMGGAYWCEDNMHRKLCSDDCMSYTDELSRGKPVCYYDSDHCNGGTPECSGKTAGEVCNELGYVCTEDCRCQPATCNNYQVDPGEECDESFGRFCGGNGNEYDVLSGCEKQCDPEKSGRFLICKNCAYAEYGATCESYCGADEICDGRRPGSMVGENGYCDDDCRFVGVCELKAASLSYDDDKDKLEMEAFFDGNCEILQFSLSKKKIPFGEENIYEVLVSPETHDIANGRLSVSYALDDDDFGILGYAKFRFLVTYAGDNLEEMQTRWSGYQRVDR